MNQKTLLLVDADADCQRIVSQAAARADYEVLLARTSAAAFEIIRQKIGCLDVMVIDFDPGAHGLALLEAISACAERPPMIVVTELEETYMGPIATQHGAVACLGKPLRLPRLLLVLRDVALHRGLTCNRWGSLIPLPAREPVNPRVRFRGITGKLSPTRTDHAQRSRK